MSDSPREMLPETAGMRDERRVLTALFADVVGSTDLSSKLDPEDAKLIIQEAVSRTIRGVEAYGGTIKDLAGDGVLALFGAPLAHEDDPERAIRAALEILVTVGDYAREVEAGWNISGFGMRLGIHTGEVVVGSVGSGGRVEYGAVGDPVNVAARLQAAAEPGTVLVSSDTRRLVTPQFEWGQPLTLNLKGRSEPVEAWSALRVLSHRTVESASALVGRETELADGMAALQALAQGRGGVVFVVGDPGIGKSRLIAEMRQPVTASVQPRWIEGRCVSYGEGLQYWPFRDLLRNWMGVSPQDPPLKVRLTLQRRMAELFGGDAAQHQPYMAELLGLAQETDSSVLRELSPESLRFRTFQVVGELVSRLAGQSPLVLVLDDLHWADPTSVELIESLLARAERERILLILVHRPETEHASWRLRERAAREYRHLVTEIQLRPLTAAGEADLLRGLTGLDDVAPEVAEQLRHYSAGNPFYLEELVRSLADRGAIAAAGSALTASRIRGLTIPTTLEGVIVARLDRLQPEWRRTLRAASVLGRGFGSAALAAVSGAEEAELENTIHNLLRLELLAEESRWPEPTYQVKHALIAETVHGTLVTSERVDLHRRAALWYEEHFAEHLDRVHGLLAHHWREANEPTRAIHFLQLAGDTAMNEWSLDEAIGHYQDLLQLMEETSDTGGARDVLFKLALALHTAMRFAEAQTVYDRAFATRRPAPVALPRLATIRWDADVLAVPGAPHVSNVWRDIHLNMQLQDRLVELRGPRHLVPRLARDWNIADGGLRYTFRLDPEACWHDGQVITAHDFVRSIRRVLDPRDPRPAAPIYFVLVGAEDHCLRGVGSVADIGVKALDDHTLEFRLIAPAPYFLNVLNRPEAGPQREDPAFCGPWRLSAATGRQVVLEHAPGYQVARTGNAAWVEITAMHGSEALAAYMADELDLLSVVGSLDDYAAIGHPPLMGAATQTHYLVGNCTNPLGASRALRRALSMSIDRAGLESVVPANLIPARGGVVPPALHGHTPEIALAFDPAGALAELRGAGIRGEVAIGVPDPATHPFRRLLESLVTTWNDHLGEQVQIVQVPLPSARVRRVSQDPPLTLMSWLPGYPDPEYYLRLLLHTDSASNLGAWSNPDFDALIEQARREQSGPARLARFHEAERLAIREEAALLPLFYGRPATFVKPWIDGWWEWGKSSSPMAELLVARP